VSNSPLPPDLIDRIAHARDLTGRPRSEPLLPYRSVGELLSRRAAETPSKAFMIWYNRDGTRGELTYHDFHRRVIGRATLLARLGIRPGDRVATYSGNFPETALIYFACWAYGATVVPLSVSEDEAHLRYIIRNSEAKSIFTRPELLDKLRSILSGGDDPISIPLQVEPVDESAEGYFPNDADLPFPDTEALIVYTSGTTGNPKGVLLDQYNLLVDGFALASHHRITSNTRMMCVLPIHHVNGTIVTMVTPLVAGSSFVLNERFSVHHFFPRLAAEGVEVVSVVPTLLAFLLEADASTDGLDLKLHHIICGAGPLTVDLAMRFEMRYHIPIAHGYGLSETTCYSCCLPVDLPTTDRRLWLSQHGYPAIGPALPVNEMAIHDPDGKPIRPGERGEIVIRGHNVMIGYYHNEPANRSAFEHGWFRSGDEGFFLPGPDGEPYYFITGRLKELIIRGGVNISPLEIDEVLMALPGVRAGIAVGFEHDLYGEEVGAYVQPDGGQALTAEAIIAACRQALPFAKCPKVVIFGDQMPVTSTGKYQRNKLRPLFAEYRTGRFSDGKGR